MPFSSRSALLLPALAYIAAYTRDNGYAPSLREIGAACGTTSTGHAKFIVDQLVIDKMLDIPLTPRGQRIPRVMRVTPHGHATLSVLTQREVTA